MKFYDTHYDEYIKSNEEVNLHPNLTPIYKKFPNTLKELNTTDIVCPISLYSLVFVGLRLSL